jgi:hypothetical protein
MLQNRFQNDFAKLTALCTIHFWTDVVELILHSSAFLRALIIQIPTKTFLKLSTIYSNIITFFSGYMYCYYLKNRTNFKGLLCNDLSGFGIFFNSASLTHFFSRVYSIQCMHRCSETNPNCTYYNLEYF